MYGNADLVYHDGDNWEEWGPSNGPWLSKLSSWCPIFYGNYLQYLYFCWINVPANSAFWPRSNGRRYLPPLHAYACPSPPWRPLRHSFVLGCPSRSCQFLRPGDLGGRSNHTTTPPPPRAFLPPPSQVGPRSMARLGHLSQTIDIFSIDSAILHPGVVWWRQRLRRLWPPQSREKVDLESAKRSNEASGLVQLLILRAAEEYCRVWWWTHQRWRFPLVVSFLRSAVCIWPFPSKLSFGSTSTLTTSPSPSSPTPTFPHLLPQYACLSFSNPPGRPWYHSSAAPGSYPKMNSEEPHLGHYHHWGYSQVRGTT